MANIITVAEVEASDVHVQLSQFVCMSFLFHLEVPTESSNLQHCMAFWKSSYLSLSTNPQPLKREAPYGAYYSFFDAIWLLKLKPTSHLLPSNYSETSLFWPPVALSKVVLISG